MATMASRNNEFSVQGVEAFQVGLANNRKGQAWSYKANGPITGIMVGYNDCFIGSLVFQSIDENGNIEYSDIFGSHDNKNDDNVSKKIILDPRQEHFTSLSGKICYHAHKKNDVITAIYFRTNKDRNVQFEPKSTVKSRKFEFSLKGGVIVGFYGRDAGKYIAEGLGVYVKQSTDFSVPISPVKEVTPEHKLVGSFDQKEFIKVGPWGWSRSLTEKEWSYMLKGATDQIKIGYNNNYIQSISFKTSNENNEFKYSQEAGTEVVKQETISFNSPGEYLVSISGTTRSLEKDIESLCFYTTKNIYGPFGPMEGNRFRFYMK